MQIAIASTLVFVAGCGARTGLDAQRIRPDAAIAVVGVLSENPQDAGVPLKPLGCTNDSVSIEGTLDGTPVRLVELATQGIPSNLASRTSLRWQAFANPGRASGMFSLQGPAIVESRPTEMSGWIRLPSDSADGTLYCVTATVSQQDEFNYTFRTTAISRLGSCPGTPVKGRVVRNETQTTSDLWTEPGGSGLEWDPRTDIGEHYPWETQLNPNLGLEFISWRRDGKFFEAFMRSPTGPNRGTFYCAGHGSSIHTGPRVTELTNITELGACNGSQPRIEGNVTGCVRSGARAILWNNDP